MEIWMMTAIICNLVAVVLSASMVSDGEKEEYPMFITGVILISTLCVLAMSALYLTHMYPVGTAFNAIGE